MQQKVVQRQAAVIDHFVLGSLCQCFLRNWAGQIIELIQRQHGVRDIPVRISAFTPRRSGRIIDMP